MKAQASLSRFKAVFFIATRHAVLHTLHRRLASWPKLACKIPGENIPGPKRFRQAIEEIGGTFIKFGQMLAMQSDLLPLNYCTALFSLFDQVPPFEYEEVEKTFIEDLGQSPSQTFESFDQRPIATGSIGQVHMATLAGRKVAVKIRRPTILSDFGADIAIMRFMVNVVKLLHIRPLYWIIAPTEEFIAWTQDELDYRREAHYMDELGRNARSNEHEKVPAVFWSCTTTRILTVEYLEGLTVSEYLRQKESGTTTVSPDFEPQLFGARLLDNFLGDAFRHGMFHADLHPGNLMIMPGNVVGYIDFGISGVLSPYSRRHLISMTLSCARGDLDAMCESFFRITALDKNANPHGFRQGLKQIAANWYGHDDDQNRLRKSITSIMLELLVLSRENGIWPQRDVIKYIRSAVALDGLVRTFAPGLDMGLTLEQACERHIKWDLMRNLISPEALTGWFGGYAHLVRDGFLRAFAVLRRASADGSPAPTLPNAGPQKKTRKYQGSRVLQLAWMAGCAAMIWAPVKFSALRVVAPVLLLVLSFCLVAAPRQQRR
jgi:predicted unusual protein kinase regulating ubiquinone biosynthesis (AarF/ABC1/UbiB family)